MLVFKGGLTMKKSDTYNLAFWLLTFLILSTLFLLLGDILNTKNTEIKELKITIQEEKAYSRELQNFIEMQNYLELDKIIEGLE